jgi:hypothetical protein
VVKVLELVVDVDVLTVLVELVVEILDVVVLVVLVGSRNRVAVFLVVVVLVLGCSVVVVSCWQLIRISVRSSM